jgi:hypothetical protein
MKTRSEEKNLMTKQIEEEFQIVVNKVRQICGRIFGGI